VGVDHDLDPIEGGGDGRAEEGLVSLIVGVRYQRYTGGEELWSGSLNDDGWVPISMKGQLVVRAGSLAILQLSLGDA
jgi:hypothetical protein